MAMPFKVRLPTTSVTFKRVRAAAPVGQERVELVPEPMGEGDLGTFQRPRSEIALDLSVAMGASLARERTGAEEVDANRVGASASRIGRESPPPAPSPGRARLPRLSRTARYR